MAELAERRISLGDVANGGIVDEFAGLTPVQWLICGVAALGFAFDLYETLVLPLIVRPALTSLGNFSAGSPESNLWVGLLFYVPLASGGLFGLLGGYLTDLLGRRRVLVWSIFLYALSACAAAFAVTLPQLLFFRCTTIIGVCVEYVAGVAWVAELFPNSKQRESVLGYTQAAFGLGGLMITAAYYVAVTCAERFPAIHSRHEAWRYTLLSGLIPALPLVLARPFLPESPIWQTKKSKGTLKRPSFAELFRPGLRKTTSVTTFLVACSYALASGVIQPLGELFAAHVPNALARHRRELRAQHWGSHNRRVGSCCSRRNWPTSCPVQSSLPNLHTQPVHSRCSLTVYHWLGVSGFASRITPSYRIDLLKGTR